MNESATPSSIDSSILESPVPDPHLFLLHQLNADFLVGRTIRPQLAKNDGSSVGYWLAMGAITFGLLFMLCNSFAQSLPRFPNPSLPSAVQLPFSDTTGILLFLAILGGIGIVVLLGDLRTARQQASVTPTAPVEQPVVVVRARPAAHVLDGVVVQSEKIVRQGQYGIEEKIGVRYEFAAPGGVITYVWVCRRVKRSCQP